MIPSAEETVGRCKMGYKSYTFCTDVLNSSANWRRKLVVLETWNMPFVYAVLCILQSFIQFYIAFMYTHIHVLYIKPVMCKNFNTYKLRIHLHVDSFFFLVSKFNQSLVLFRLLQVSNTTQSTRVDTQPTETPALMPYYTIRPFKLKWDDL